MLNCTRNQRHTSGRVSEVCFFAAILFSSAALAQVESGPKAGEKPPAFQSFGVTGEVTDKEVDYLQHRAGKPTVFLFVQARDWSRPMARFLKVLDKVLADSPADDYAVAVWLTDDVAASKEYLPKAQMSLQFTHTALTVFPGDKAGPNNWGVSDRATLTTVVVRDGKVVASFGYISVNETDVPKVKEALLPGK